MPEAAAASSPPWHPMLRRHQGAIHRALGMGLCRCRLRPRLDTDHRRLPRSRVPWKRALCPLPSHLWMAARRPSQFQFWPLVIRRLIQVFFHSSLSLSSSFIILFFSSWLFPPTIGALFFFFPSHPILALAKASYRWPQAVATPHLAPHLRSTPAISVSWPRVASPRQRGCGR